MQLHKNVLKTETISIFRNELTKNLSKKCWAISSLFWPENIMVGIQGSCAISDLSKDLENRIINDIKELLPSYRELKIQCYVWDKNSAISKHNDHAYKFGATIYMNERWDMNYGGIFLWTPNGEKEYSAIIPECNNMVLNDKREWHMVTPVSPYIKEPRITIQIWGLE